MSHTDNFVFTTVRIIAWVIFVGLCIEAGALIVNFIFSLASPEFLPRLYQKLDISQIKQINKSAFFGAYSFILAISILKAMLFYLVIVLVTKLDLGKPFNEFVSNQILKISYYTFAIGILSYIGQQSINNLAKDNVLVEKVDGFWEDSQAFILMAAVIYTIAIIFKKGLELQHEKDLTV